MRGEQLEEISKYVAVFERGLVSGAEVTNTVLDELVRADAPHDEIESVFRMLPQGVDKPMIERLNEIAESDYLIWDFVCSDVRTEEESHASSLARQPKLRRICPLLLDLAVARSFRDSG